MGASLIGRNYLPYHLKFLKLLKHTVEPYVVWKQLNHKKKILIAWDKVCTPRSCGGLNITNLHCWNNSKTCWDLANKQDKLWIRWVHSYCIKGQPFGSILVPQQACWMIKKILEARTTLELTLYTKKPGQSLIRHIYLRLLEDRPRVP